MKKILLITTVIFLSCVSCSDDILDITPKDRISEEAVWEDENLIKAYHNELYNCILHGFKIHMPSKATDEVVNNMDWTIGIVPLGNVNADNVTTLADTDWTGGGNLYYWDTGYRYMRKINIFLEEMSDENISFADKSRLVAEAKFLRAYTYFLLIERFGGVPIVTDTYELGAKTSVERNTFEECVDFIEKDLREAMPDLPERYEASDGNFGRATQDVCQALLSRTFLYAASPLFNQNNDEERWQKAADAAEKLLDKGYSLYPDYRELFNQPSGSANNELIFARTFSSTNSHSAPMDNLGRRYGGYGGWWASNGPSQNLVDDYDMESGEPPFIEQNGEKIVNTESGYDPQNPYENRDPRFYATVIHDGSTYHGDLHEMWVASDGDSWGYDSYKESTDNPRGGYILKKFMPGEEMPLSWQEDYTQPWIIFRLGEIYLNYAEAMFELGNEDVAREYLNKVRARVEMPEIPEDVTGEELRKRIYNERRVELAFENHRYFDVRRWKIAMETENEPLYGMDIIKDVETGEKSYSPVKRVERSFEEKHYLLPIHSEEVRRISIEQNPGYE